MAGIGLQEAATLRKGMLPRQVYQSQAVEDGGRQGPGCSAKVDYAVALTKRGHDPAEAASAKVSSNNRIEK